MEVYELTPSRQNKREWNRRGYGMCALDASGATWFNPLSISHAAVLLALSSGADCQIHEIDGNEHMLVRITWAKEMFPDLTADLEGLDYRIRRLARGEPLEQWN
jgi:hypothetical protein